MINIKQGTGFPLGTKVNGKGIQFTIATKLNNVNLVIHNSKTSEDLKFSMGNPVYGNIYSIILEDIDFKDISYFYESNNLKINDLYASKVIGNEIYGIKDDKYDVTYGCINHDLFDWENDSNPMIPYEEMLMYLLHVRGFTAHKSSKVKNKGTFEGIIEKIDYIKKLGFNSIELMPLYEFEEYEFPSKVMQELNKVSGLDVKGKMNYWGYKDAYYFSPKQSYSASKEASQSFKNLVKGFHQEKMEVIMQFYFPDEISANYIVDVLKYWVINYHVDGFNLKGNKIPFTFIANDPFFATTKLMYHYIPENEIYDYKENPDYKNLCLYSDSFMYSMRRALKGDEDCVKELASNLKNVPDKTGITKFITNYYGFTLNDLVSYDRKHNEENGENNSDGTDYNFSWNCGIEGKTKKNSILSLRKKMIKNALFLLFTSKGTPVLFAGDEILNSQNGNNNPYCQDNEISYVNWNNNALSNEIKEFVKQMIDFRKNILNPLMNKDLTMLDKNNIGYPDFSYHSDEAWKTDFANYNRHLGTMYSKVDNDSGKVELYYFAYNFYWEDIKFSLPNLPNDVEWNVVFNTGLVKNTDKLNDFEVEQRSCSVFKASFDKKIITR